MKRIGILTFHRAINYGAYLQSFSLQRFLASQLPEAEVEIIDYIPPIEKKKIYRNVLGTLKRKGVKHALQELKKVRVFSKSMSLQKCSPARMSDADLNKLYTYIGSRYDLVVVGSDAVWNWNQNGFPSAFYLDADLSIPVLSYAACAHGLKYLDISAEQRAYCKRCFDRFSMLAVRDSGTEDFIRYCGCESPVAHVCDPTFLINKEEVRQTAGEIDRTVAGRYGFDLKQEYIVTMVLNETIQKQVRDLFGKDMKIVTLFKPNPYADVFLYDLDPFQWAMVLSKANLVITQYFHGALLSMRFGTSTMVVDASKYDSKYESKLKDLMLTRLDLPDRYITEQALIADGDRYWETAKEILHRNEDEFLNAKMDQEALTSQIFVERLREAIR